MVKNRNIHRSNVSIQELSQFSEEKKKEAERQCLHLSRKICCIKPAMTAEEILSGPCYVSQITVFSPRIFFPKKTISVL